LFLRSRFSLKTVSGVVQSFLKGPVPEDCICLEGHVRLCQHVFCHYNPLYHPMYMQAEDGEVCFVFGVPVSCEPCLSLPLSE
jgi:hypothetical protein